ncbi:MAG TPA: diguanylate cyclase [Acidimicrobiales bacterium]|nr:diguanylate cyclase [Acidimicrobiales bacterium]
MTDLFDTAASSPLGLERQVLVDALFAHCSDVIALVEPDTTIRYLNPVVETMLGFTVAELLGSQAIQLVHPKDRPRVAERLLLPPEQFDAAEPIVLRLRQADGDWRAVEVLANNRVSNPLIQGIIVTVRDLSERLSRTEALRQQRDLFDAVIDHASALVVVVDKDGVIVCYNRACEELSGIPADRVVGRGWEMLVTPDEAERLRQGLASLGRNQRSIESTVKWLTASGDELIVDWLSSAIIDEHGKISFVVSTGRDTTMHRREVERLRRGALHDPLTGLPNRTLLVDRLTTALRRGARSSQSVSVLFCDLDHFKRINDSFGHAVGDVVLAEVAARLEQACRAEDTVARIGGDEFVILVEGVDTDEALPSLVGRVCAAFREPILAGGVRVNLSVSVGVASTTADDQDGETLLGRADRAMYADKRSGRRQIPA